MSLPTAARVVKVTLPFLIFVSIPFTIWVVTTFRETRTQAASLPKIDKQFTPVDLSRMESSYLNSGDLDLNSDGRVDSGDFAIFAANYSN